MTRYRAVGFNRALSGGRGRLCPLPSPRAPQDRALLSPKGCEGPACVPRGALGQELRAPGCCSSHHTGRRLRPPPPHGPRGQAASPQGPPHRSRAPLAWVCELHPNTCTSPFRPNKRGFTVSERDAGDAPLSQAGLWEPPQDHPAHVCNTPSRAGSRGLGSHPLAMRAGSWDSRLLAQVPRAGRSGQRCHAGSDRRGAAHPSQPIAVGRCSQKEQAGSTQGSRHRQPSTVVGRCH